MWQCYLRASGTSFDVDAYVASSTLAWNPVRRRGERRAFARSGCAAEYEESSITTLAGEGDSLEAQVNEVIAFLRDNEGEMARLAKAPGVEHVVLDFSAAWREDMVAQFSRLPPELLSLASRHGFWIEISHYATSGSDAAEPE